MIGLFASAQEVADKMYIYGTDKTIERIAVNVLTVLHLPLQRVLFLPNIHH